MNNKELVNELIELDESVIEPAEQVIEYILDSIEFNMGDTRSTQVHLVYLLGMIATINSIVDLFGFTRLEISDSALRYDNLMNRFSKVAENDLEKRLIKNSFTWK